MISLHVESVDIGDYYTPQPKQQILPILGQRSR